MKTTTLNIEGMSCGHCTAAVKKALEAIAGVQSAQVSLTEKNAVVEHDETVSPDALKAAVTEEGYEVK